MHAFDLLARAAFALAGGALMLLALGLVGVAGFQVAGTRWPPDAETGRALLDGVGYTIIAIAVVYVIMLLVFALWGRHNLVLSPEEEYALKTRNESA